ncbi:TIGR03943 family putative permease subunit [Salinibacterium soli]|uniref:TIGR03943 family protein n=1 Tax=Antiquaquibacter soli TaxID=3064523 RepID=A0ABT9BML8_9MICO|nr:TIGR03943 family protein [Protaetiibacter sp. WY-16]MDO7882276.1 TIGR03943 family protein [Protaetiibacter sp. WY-16]
MSWLSIQRWRGVVLVGLAAVATVVLAATGQLVLYIHPRYVVFTVIMVVLAFLLVLASALLSKPDDEDAPASPFSKALSVGAVALAALLAVAMVALPAATLSSATADQRDINSTAIGASDTDLEDAAAVPTAEFAAFTVLDWASLLRQTTDLAFYRDKPVDVVGFITPDASDPDVFYVSRFFVTCCAVDAQPAGVPVYLPGWASQFEADDWVRVTGQFAANPSSGSAEPLAIDPDDVLAVEQPSEPYLF